MSPRQTFKSAMRDVRWVLGVLLVCWPLAFDVLLVVEPWVPEPRVMVTVTAFALFVSVGWLLTYATVAASAWSQVLADRLAEWSWGLMHEASNGQSQSPKGGSRG